MVREGIGLSVPVSKDIEKFADGEMTSGESPADRQIFDRPLRDNGQLGYSVYSLSTALLGQAFRFSKPCRSMILQLPQILTCLVKIPDRAAVQGWHELCICTKTEVFKTMNEGNGSYEKRKNSNSIFQPKIP
jgi:hypothetical protein